MPCSSENQTLLMKRCLRNTACEMLFMVSYKTSRFLARNLPAASRADQHWLWDGTCSHGNRQEAGIRQFVRSNILPQNQHCLWDGVGPTTFTRWRCQQECNGPVIAAVYLPLNTAHVKVSNYLLSRSAHGKICKVPAWSFISFFNWREFSSIHYLKVLPDCTATSFW